MSTYTTHGCNVGVNQILLPRVTGPGVTQITVTRVNTSVQGTLSGTIANIYLNDTAFTGFSTYVQNTPQATVEFTAQSPIIPSPFLWP